MRYPKVILILSFILALILVSCTKKNDIFINESQIRIVTKGKLELNNNYKREFAINKATDTEIFLSSPSKIRLKDNRVFILDSQIDCIYILNKNGEFINKIGASGKGPGEFVNLRDFDLSKEFIICLDKSKYAITKFELIKFVWEKKIPNEIVENISPENITFDGNNIFISGFSINNTNSTTPLCYELNDNLEITNKYMIYKNIKGTASFETNVIRSAHILQIKNNIIFCGMIKGNNLLYLYDTKKDAFEYKVVKNEKVKSSKYKEKNKQASFELYSLYNIIDMYISENYIVTSENAGGLEREPLKIPNNYYNNIVLYSLKGEYLFSFEDRSIPYCFYGLNCAIEELNGGLNLYLTSPEEGLFLKYFIEIWQNIGL